jgi:hypothetical protein
VGLIGRKASLTENVAAAEAAEGILQKYYLLPGSLPIKMRFGATTRGYGRILQKYYLLPGHSL